MITPNEVVMCLRRMAAAIYAADHPSKSLVAGDLFRLILATDKTFALKVQKAMLSEMARLLPKDFKEGVTYDTNPSGKGWVAGRVSFGAPVDTWLKNGLIGGLHVEMVYIDFKSKEPDPSENWPGRLDEGGNPIQHDIIGFKTACGFYSHKLGHAIDPTGGYYQDLGETVIEIDNFEEIVDVDVSNKFVPGIQKVIDDVVTTPPEGAKGVAYRLERERESPTYSVKNLVDYKLQQNSWDITPKEFKEVVDNYIKRNPGAGSRLMVEKKIRNQLKGFNLL